MPRHDDTAAMHPRFKAFVPDDKASVSQLIGRLDRRSPWQRGKRFRERDRAFWRNDPFRVWTTAEGIKLNFHLSPLLDVRIRTADAQKHGGS